MNLSRPRSTALISRLTTGSLYEGYILALRPQPFGAGVDDLVHRHLEADLEGCPAPAVAYVYDS